MEAHFWALHLNEANPDCSKFIPDEAQRHPSKMTQAHKNTVAQQQEQEEWPSDDDAPAAAPDPSSEDSGLRPWSPGTPASADPCLDDLVGNLISSANALADYVKKKPYCRHRRTVASSPRRGTAGSSAARWRSKSPRRSRRSISLSPGSAYEDWLRWRERKPTSAAREEGPRW